MKHIFLHFSLFRSYSFQSFFSCVLLSLSSTFYLSPLSFFAYPLLSLSVFLVCLLLSFLLPSIFLLWLSLSTNFSFCFYLFLCLLLSFLDFFNFHSLPVFYYNPVLFSLSFCAFVLLFLSFCSSFLYFLPSSFLPTFSAYFSTFFFLFYFSYFVLLSTLFNYLVLILFLYFLWISVISSHSHLLFSLLRANFLAFPHSSTWFVVSSDFLHKGHFVSVLSLL